MKIISRLLVLVIFIAFSTEILSAQIVEIGNASFYADKFKGRTTASGAIFKQNKLTAAHKTLPFGSRVRVTNLDNNKVVDVIINDRGPFAKNRIIDLSKSGAKKLDFINKGVTKVKIEVLGTSNVNHAVSNLSNGDYYEVITKRVVPKGFGIQIASYKESANLIKHLDVIKNQINKNVLVQIVKVKGQKFYRIILGDFSTRKSANMYNKKIKNKFEGSIVIAF